MQRLLVRRVALAAAAVALLLFSLAHREKIVRQTDYFAGDYLSDRVENKTVSRSPMCTMLDPKPCAKPLMPFKQRYRAAQSFRLMGCAIEKNFSTLLTAILCYLHNIEQFKKSGRKLTKETFHGRLCHYNEFVSIAEWKKKYQISSDELSTWKQIAIVRNPTDRFISGFVDKCLKEKTWKQFTSRCNYCKEDLDCFIRRQYERVMNYSSGLPMKFSFDDDHFFPQSWRCEFRTNLNAFTVMRYDSKDDTFINNMANLFIENQVPKEEADFIVEQVKTSRTGHSTVEFGARSSIEERVRGNREYMEMIYRMYYHDYVLFGFPLPEF